MAKETVNILKDKIDIVELLAQLNAALSEEWLAFYQYWVGSFVVEGAMRGDVQREFQEHAAEEYNHVNPEKPDVPLNKNDAFQKVQKRHVQEKR